MRFPFLSYLPMLSIDLPKTWDGIKLHVSRQESQERDHMGALHRKTNNNISICSPANIISALPCVQGYTFPLQGADAFLLSGLRVEAGPALPVVLPSQSDL